MSKKRIHWMGGIRTELGRMFTVRLPGWPACVSGDRAVEVAKQGNMTRVRENVNCKGCLRLLEAQDKYQEKLQGQP